MPEQTILGRFVYTTDEMVQLNRTYIAQNRGMVLPLESHRLFHAIESFDPDAHCVRPWEMDRLLELYEQIQAACLCNASSSDPSPTDGDAGADPFSMPLSPCCMP